MTSKAREVLKDCRIALAMLEEVETDDRWRIHWAAAVALIRAVGHVLHRVDSRRGKTEAQAVRNAYARWKTDRSQHEIFHEFIEKERNNLLKEYHSDVHPISEVSLAFETTLTPLGGGEPVSVSEVLTLDRSIYRPMLVGPYSDDDARDVLAAAIDWWEKELDAIDGEVNAANQKL